MRRPLLSLLLLICSHFTLLHAQPGYTADDIVTQYTGQYRTGMNMGYFPGWDNYKLADIAAGNPDPAINQNGVGARALRFSAPEEILDQYGYGLLLPEIQHYSSLNTAEHTALIWGPKGIHRDLNQYCPGKPSALFSNMYTPIWDGGANGTPYNDQNYLAAYLYKVATTYKGKIRFWEIWNEPGLDLRFDIGGIGWRDPSYPGNWWAEGPNPCDYILHAPIYHYIRVLRISWEVIKTVDPDAYVCLGSVGYPSLLNAICANTDNPNMGDVTAEFPKSGAAYFDAVTFHSYPHFDGATTNFNAGLFARHSDQAADGVISYRQLYQSVLDQYGYNGVTKPRKNWIITELNSPRKVFGLAFGGAPQLGPFFGGYEAQINHLMKAIMVSKVSGIHQTHVYELFDRKNDMTAGYEFDLMGMYKELNGAPAYQITVNDAGIAVKTTSDMVHNTTYDPLRTAQMALPGNLRGYAFKRTDGTYVYAIWARTTQDLSENASGTYTFPASFGLSQVDRYEWNSGYTNQKTTVSASNIALTARPVFFTVTSTQPPCALVASANEIACNNNGTPSNPADDTYSFQLSVQGGGSSGWTAIVGGNNVTGSYGVSTSVGPFPITPNPLTITIRDATSSNCVTTVTVTPPPTCSNVTNCTISALVSNKVCNDNGTPSDPSDDTWTFGVTISASGTTCGTGWYGGNTSATYGALRTFGPYPIANGNQFLGFEDNANSSITASVNVSPPATCSNLPATCDAASNTSAREWIGQVEVANMSNTTGRSNYTDYSSSKVVNLVRGTNVACNLTTAYTYFTYDEYFRVWIDYNKNNVFEAQEVVFQGINLRPALGTISKTLSGAISVPANAPTGTTKMRVSMARGAYPDPCANFARGEVEDYAVFIAQQSMERSEILDTQAESNLIQVYPNPNQGQAVLDLRDWVTLAAHSEVSEGQEVKLTVFNTIGEVIYQSDESLTSTGLIDLNLTQAPQGNYLVRIEMTGFRPAIKRITVAARP